MAAKIRSDLVEVIRGARPTRRRRPSATPAVLRRASSPKPGDKGKQGRVIRCSRLRARSSSRAQPKTHHVRQGQQGRRRHREDRSPDPRVQGRDLVDPETKKRVRVGFREDTVERDGRTRTVRVRVARGRRKRGVEPRQGDLSMAPRLKDKYVSEIREALRRLSSSTRTSCRSAD